jgi:cytochrome c biogenesis protein
MPAQVSLARRIYQTIGSVRTGIILLIVVAIISALGTIVLQRPITEPDQLQRAYSPETLRILDALGLTDVFHAWWFALLLILLSTSIVIVCLDRWPNTWRFFARPYRYPESHFRAVLPLRSEIPVQDPQAALRTAERVFRKNGLHPERVVEQENVAVYGERNRLSLLAVYVIHASLLLIFLGGIIDAFWGYKGYISLVPGEQTNTVPLRLAGGKEREKVLNFSIRCDGTGQENYPDGTPKKWWSKLAIVENGRETYRKEIVVNDPLVYGGVRFFQSGFGRSDKPGGMVLRVMPNPSATQKAQADAPGRIKLAMNQSAQVDPNTFVRATQYISDAYEMDGQVYRRSKNLVRPAFKLQVETRDKSGALQPASEFWVMWDADAPSTSKESPYSFQLADLDFPNATGLQVSYEPGQWAVWGGVILMGVGMFMAFYLVHIRFWAVVVPDAQGGTKLWVGAAANKNREAFEQRFYHLAEEIRAQVESQSKTCALAQESSMAAV